MIADDDNGSTRIASDAQVGRNLGQNLQGPVEINLIGAGELRIHCVMNKAHHFPP